MKISFLGSAHGIRAVKTFTDEGVKSYPQIRNFNSKSYDLPLTIEGLREKARLIRYHANLGDCMVKGYLNKDLACESRAGAVDREALTNTLMLDIDGILLPHVTVSLPIDGRQLEYLAEKIVGQLPTAFHGVSYIVHASSSMGMKGNKICLHLDFLLEDPVAPQALKEYVVHLNHALPLFEQNFSLSASGTALRFPLDRTVVDNSHLIFLAPPLFQGAVGNPIPDDDDRIFLVERSKLAVNLTQEIKDNCNTDRTRKLNDKKINELRDLQGLPRRQEKSTRVNVDGRQLHVVINPEAVQMSFAADNGLFVAYNINGGDSGGYYVQKYKPTVVRNFKGEPNFLFEMADPETYKWHLETFIGQVEPDKVDPDTETPPMPLVFRDMQSSAYYNALINTQTGLIAEIAKADRGALEDFILQYEGVMPENVPTWHYEFDPHRNVTLSYSERFINKYIPSQYIRMATKPAEHLVPLSYDTALQLGQYCPTITEVILHALGRDTDMFTHFLNWLAAAFQSKDKLGTAWILQGTQGTGKGILFDSIITPLVGHGISEAQPYAAKVRIENVEDQFNQWMECALFVAFDEFRLDDSANNRKLFNKIKSMITEKMEPIRGMRENLRHVRTYSNYLIFSNDQDVITIPADDRRFNVCPRQEEKLNTVFGDMRDVIDNRIPDELKDFAAALIHFEVDWHKAGQVIENEAKRAMRQVSQTSIQDFVHAFKHGDFEFFLPILDMPDLAPGVSYVLPAKTILRGHLRDMDKGDMHRLTVEELRILYCALISNKSENASKFSKLMGRHGLESKKMRIHKSVQRGYELQWNVVDNKLEDLQREYLRSVDHHFAPEKPTNVIQIKEKP